MKKKLTSVLLFLAMSVGVVSAQTSKVTGKVIGEDGEPVIGASIIVKGTTVGTVTDFDGNFELEVPANGKQLVISYIGMKSQEVAATSNVNVKLLADTQNLDEVVVTAMGISKEKKALGYAVQDVKADELTKGANTSLSGALRLSGNFWLVSFKISYLCLPLFYETRTTPSCHPSGCAYRQL